MKIELQAFLLRSDIPPEGKARPDTDDGADNQELKEPLRTAAIEAGLTKMRRPPVIAYTLPSMEATEYAKEQGKDDEFHKACYKAYWEEFQDIGKLEVLEGIATDCGLDWSQLEERLGSGHYRETVLKQYKADVGMAALTRKLRPYGLLAVAVVLVIAAVRYVDLSTVEWILRGAPSVEAERPSGSITVQGRDFSLDGFRQLLSRDGITPIYDPKFVSAAKASFGDNDLVMGITINGESKAYPVGMLNFREMVIDELGGVPILVTW